MKILDRYIIKSILKVGIVAILVFALILVAVELFGRMDNIMTGSIPFKSILEYAVLSVPQYLMMVSSLAFLFATTYFLSMLSANNERIALLTAGLGKKRIALPIIVSNVSIGIISSPTSLHIYFFKKHLGSLPTLPRIFFEDLID